jgi:hypothetical protein
MCSSGDCVGQSKVLMSLSVFTGELTQKGGGGVIVLTDKGVHTKDIGKNNCDN